MDNRKRILEVSLDLFYDKGYDAISVQEIVDRAGITKPTLYYYYGSKLGLLESLLDEGFRRLWQQLEPALHGHHETNAENGFDIPERLFQVAKAFLTFANNDSKFFYFMLSLMYSARSNEPYLTVKPHLYKLYKEITDFFERYGEQLGNMNGRQEIFAMGYLGFLTQYAFTFSEKHYKESRALDDHVADEQIQALVHQFMYGIVN